MLCFHAKIRFFLEIFRIYNWLTMKHLLLLYSGCHGYNLEIRNRISEIRYLVFARGLSVLQIAIGAWKIFSGIEQHWKSIGTIERHWTPFNTEKHLTVQIHYIFSGSQCFSVSLNGFHWFPVFSGRKYVQTSEKFQYRMTNRVFDI